MSGGGWMSITKTSEDEMSRIAVVTGAGSGVGRAVVLELSKRGFDIALIGRREEPLRETIALAHSRERKLRCISSSTLRARDKRTPRNSVRRAKWRGYFRFR